MDLGKLFSNNVLDSQSGLGLDSKNLSGLSFGNKPDEGFVDLLGLVDDLEVAELSEASDPEMTWTKALKDLDDVDFESLEAQRKKEIFSLDSKQILPETNIGVVQKEVGQHEQLNHVEISSENLKTLSAEKDLLANSHHFNLKQQSVPKLNMDSVAAWTTAMSSGELKEMSIAKESMPSIRVDSALSAKAVFDLSEGPKTTKFDGPQQMVSKNAFDRPVLEADLKQNVEGLDKEALNGVNKKFETSDLPKVSSSQAFDVVVSDQKQPLKSQDAKDFLFDRSNVGFQAVSHSALASSDLNGALSKTDMADKIDSRTIDFVADKVSDLKQAGGGTIRLGLETKDSGQLQIKVTLRGAKVDVQIDASDAALRGELNLKKPELLSSLSSKVDVGSIEIARLSKHIDASHLGSVKAQAQQIFMSSEIIKNMSGPDIADSLSVRGFEKSDVTNTTLVDGDKSSSQFSSKEGSQGFSRDQRREEAMNQWANFSDQMKKSA